MGTTLKCVNYTTQSFADTTRTLTAQVMTMGTCEGASFSNMYTLDMCANLSSALSVNTGTTLIMQPFNYYCLPYSYNGDAWLAHCELDSRGKVWQVSKRVPIQQRYQ